jgi:hypothetical protein
VKAGSQTLIFELQHRHNSSVVPVQFEKANLHRCWMETMNKLSSYSHRVSENRDVMAASEFARWLSFSGLLSMFKANPQDAPLKVDGALLEWTVNQLIERCNERFRTNNGDPKLTVDEFESLHDKVDRLLRNQDTMAGFVARLASPPPLAPVADEPSLAVIPGGLTD